MNTKTNNTPNPKTTLEHFRKVLATADTPVVHQPIPFSSSRTGDTSTTATATTTATASGLSTAQSSSKQTSKTTTAATSKVTTETFQTPSVSQKPSQFSSKISSKARTGEDFFDDENIEIEILPYNSIFDWTVQDSLGYYREADRYDLFHMEWGNDETQGNVIETLFDDREKYHILRRFPWPPKFLCGSIFYSRGYYEDYEPRPTKGIVEIPQEIKENKLKKLPVFKKTLKKLILSVNLFDKKAKANAGNEGLPGSNEPLKFLRDYNTKIYDILRLIMHDVPKETNEDFLTRMYPKCIKTKVKKDPDLSGHYYAEITFAIVEDAAEAFQQSKIKKINGHPMNLVPVLIKDEEVEDSKATTEPASRIVGVNQEKTKDKKHKHQKHGKH